MTLQIEASRTRVTRVCVRRDCRKDERCGAMPAARLIVVWSNGRARLAARSPRLVAFAAATCSPR